MHRTTIMIPDTLKSRLEKEAVQEKKSFGQLVRDALEKYLSIKRDPYQYDSFFSSKTILEDNGPSDTALRHDTYLYK